jgi:hypothetical protein
MTSAKAPGPDLKVFGRPGRVTAWREGKPYVAELAENSAGR